MITYMLKIAVCMCVCICVCICLCVGVRVCNVLLRLMLTEVPDQAISQKV